MIMSCRNLINRLVFAYNRIIKKNEGNIRSDYIEGLSINLDASFQLLKQTNDERDRLTEKKAARLHILDEKFFLDIHSSSGTILMVVRKSTEEIINVNDSFYNILGYSNQDIIGKTCSQANIWVDNQDIIITRNLLQETKIIKQQIFQFQTKSGDIKDFLLSAEEIDIDEQTLIFYMASDITYITQNSCCMSYRCLNDPDYTMKYISYDCEKLTGYQIKNIISNTIPFASIIYQDDVNYVWDKVQEALTKQKIYEISYRIKTKSGQIKWVWEKGQGIFYNNNDNNESLALEGLIEDITDLKNAEEKLSQVRSNLREQIQQTIKGLQNNHSGLKLVQEIPVLIDALSVDNITDIAALAKLLMPENIADDIEPELHLTAMALSRVALTLQSYQVIKEPLIQDKIILSAKKELKTVVKQVNNLPASSQVLINQIIRRWDSIINNPEVPSEEV